MKKEKLVVIDADNKQMVIKIFSTTFTKGGVLDDDCLEERILIPIEKLWKLFFDKTIVSCLVERY